MIIWIYGVSVPLYTSGLPGGFYNYYAVDVDGRVSLQGKQWVTVKETGPVLGFGADMKPLSFAAFQFNDQILVDPDSHEPYSLEIFTISGKLWHRDSNLLGIQHIDLKGRRGLMVVRKNSGSKISILKIITH